MKSIRDFELSQLKGGTDFPILRDPNGNIIFNPIGSGIVTHVSGSTAPVVMGYIYADDGTKIEVYQNNGGSNGWDTDCHGVSFADGQYWINNNQVDEILSGDNYSQLSGGYMSGDVVVYYDSSGNVVHSATISSTNGTASGTIVYGQGGLESQNHYDNIVNAYSAYSTYMAYRGDGDRQLTQSEYNSFIQNDYEF